MDREKTGALIAQARREKQMTQKELARMLHVSDRAVSKWERGAGFPDVSLLEPLGKALDVPVLDLLRGERGAAGDADAAVAQTLEAVTETRRTRRRQRLRTAGNFLFCIAVLWCALAAFGFTRLPVDRTVTAGVFQAGTLTAVTEVRAKGWIVCGVLPWDLEYQGRFWVPLDDAAGRVRYRIPIRGEGEAHAGHKSWSGNLTGLDGPFMGNRFCLTPGMEDFALDLTDGTVIATSWDQYARFVETYGGIPLPAAE